MNTKQAIKDLKETYPKVIDITDNWLLFCQIHGEMQSPAEVKTLKKFAKAMNFITRKSKK